MYEALFVICRHPPFLENVANKNMRYQLSPGKKIIAIALRVTSVRIYGWNTKKTRFLVLRHDFRWLRWPRFQHFWSKIDYSTSTENKILTRCPIHLIFHSSDTWDIDFSRWDIFKKGGWKGGWLLSVTWSCRICENVWFFTSLSPYTSQMTTWRCEPMFRKITPLSTPLSKVLKILFATIFCLVDTISCFFRQF